MKLFVMSDIHSYHFSMMQALYKNGFQHDNPEHHLVICGDLFDRGPDAVKTFEFVKEMADKGRLTYIRGNHEDLLFDCVNEIGRGFVSDHHIRNGTFDTIVQFTQMGYYDLRYGFANKEWYDKIRPLLDFIEENTVDSAVAGDYVFVHGWVPCESKDTNIYHGTKKFTNVCPDIFNSEKESFHDEWAAARWINGMLAWSQGMTLPGKTIVCGHWHTSWGHSRLHHEGEEFPQKTSDDWRKAFEPFVDEGIVAIDACTAYSGFCNCWTIEI